jgi:hypothetical protein
MVEAPLPETPAGNPRGRDPAVSVAGTEHHSIVEKMDWRQMKGLYDLVIKQKDEASRGSDMVIDASRFGGSDNVSDLSDNTSRETLEAGEQKLSRRVAAAATSARGSGRATQTQPQAHAAPQTQGQTQTQGQQTQAKGGGALGEAETEYISSIVSISDSLSVTALEDLVSYLNQVLHVKTRGESETREVAHMEHASSFASDEFSGGKQRRSNSSAMGTHSPDSRRQTPHQMELGSPYMLSQSAPSSFFAGAAPLVKRTKAVSAAKASGSAREYEDEDDEEIKSLSSNRNPASEHDKHDHTTTTTTPTAPRRVGTPSSSPKPRRSFTSTPTRTPPNGLRSGAVPPVPYGSADSDGGGIMTMASAPSLSVGQRATQSDRSKKRNSESPIVISNTPVVSSAVNPVCIRKESSDGSSGPSGSLLKIAVPGDQSAGHSKKPRYASHTPAAEASRAPGSGRGLPEFHMSPNCAFEDCSVHSGSSASYYSSSQPAGGYQ